MLLEIEQYYQVRFSEIDRISDDNFTIIKILHESIGNNEMFFNLDTSIEMPLIDFEDRQKFKNLNQTTPNDISIVQENFPITLYGQEILFSERIYRLYNPYISNLEDFLRAETNTIHVSSRSGKASEQYFFKNNSGVNSNRVN